MSTELIHIPIKIFNIGEEASADGGILKNKKIDSLLYVEMFELY